LKRFFFEKLKKVSVTASKIINNNAKHEVEAATSNSALNQLIKSHCQLISSLNQEFKVINLKLAQPVTE